MNDRAVLQVEDTPHVSVVIPVRNEATYIAGCLESILSQDYCHIVEILVFDGMSNDGTREIIAEFQRHHSSIAVIDNPKKNKWIGVNKGIGAAQGDVISIVDAHAVYEADYVSQCVEYLVKTGAANVGGPAIPRARSSYQGKAIAFAHQSRFGIGVAKFRQALHEGYVDTVWPGAFWKSIVTEIGPFREDLPRSGDIEWNTRLRQRGYKVFCTPKIRAIYSPRENLSGLWKQNFANGVGIAQAIFVNRGAVRLRHLVPLLFLLAIMASVLGAFFSSLGRSLLVGILASYLVPCFLFGAKIAIKNGIQYLPIMPVVFWTIHVSYGLGSIWGLLKFGLTERWKH